MNLVADECCDAQLVAGLRSDGHDVVYVQEIAPGTDDDTVLQMAAGQHHPQRLPGSFVVLDEKKARFRSL